MTAAPPALRVTKQPPTRGEVVVWGMLARAPYGGMTWQVLHHLAGLRRLGFDVWYVEDSDCMLTDPATYWPTVAYEANVRHLAAQLERIGLGERWAFRPPRTNEYLGALDRHGVAALYARADAVFNLCGSQELLARHDDIRCLVLLETDPTFKQIGIVKGNPRCLTEVERYDHLFTYGTNLFGASCTIPVERYHWNITRPPVVVDWWSEEPSSDAGALTTIATWKHTDRDLEWEGKRLRWTKHRQFRRFWDLPRRSELPLEIALRGATTEEQAELERYGWQLRDAADFADPDAYRSYVRSSAGEFSFAKEMVVETQVGWLSDRTVCYLAAGRPVIVQDTGFGTAVPAEGGLRAFRDVESALDAISIVASQPQLERKLALELANDVFAAEVVLGEVTSAIGLG
jgi:hypothetical protein